MQEILLKYGCNPNQQKARIFMEESQLPLEVLSGNPGYINLLDALNSYQLVKELKATLNKPAAASFKHVSPAGAAIASTLSEAQQKAFFVNSSSLSPLALAYAKARGSDRLCSYGDYIALSDECDEDTALLIKPEVSDGIIAPSFSKKALEILKQKRNGRYTVVKIDSDYVPDTLEYRKVFGITFEQQRNSIKIDEGMLKDIVTENKLLPLQAKQDLLLSLITLKYTQSNSVCLAKDGMTIGIGAGQQSRIHCTRLASDKADIFNLRFQPKVLDLPFLPKLSRIDRDNAIDTYISKDSAKLLNDWSKYFLTRPDELTEEEKRVYISKISSVSLGSDAFFPFPDNILRAASSGVSYVVEAGGSVRDDEVIAAADSLGMIMVFCHTRFFHH